MGITDYSEVEIPSERLVMRAWRGEDASALLKLRGDVGLMRYWSHAPYQSMDDAVEGLSGMMAANENCSGLELAVCLKEAVIGTVAIHGISWSSRRGELGYLLARGNQGMGLMHEALVAVVGYAFGEMGLNRLEADIDPRNVGSKKSLERLGFRREGYMPERWIVGGEVTDTEFFGLLATDWKSVHNGGFPN